MASKKPSKVKPEDAQEAEEEKDPDSDIKKEEIQADDSAEDSNEKEVKKEESLEKPVEPSGELIVDVSEQKSYGWLLIVGAILAVIILIGGLLFYYKGIQNSITPVGPSPIPTKAPSAELDPTPTATPSAKVNKEEFGIEILNGSGKSGQAASMQEVLEEAGFKVDSIGNADDSSYTDSEISAKEGVEKAFLDELIKELSKAYVVSEKIGELEDDEDSDIIIIVGSSKLE